RGRARWRGCGRTGRAGRNGRYGVEGIADADVRRRGGVDRDGEDARGDNRAGPSRDRIPEGFTPKAAARLGAGAQSADYEGSVDLGEAPRGGGDRKSTRLNSSY